MTELKPDAVYWVLSSREQILTAANGSESGISSQKAYLHNNHLGSVAFETDESGAVSQASLYQPYGASSTDGNKASQKVSTYSFSGKEEDGSGLYYFEARYYDPVTTRFVSPDPLFAVDMAKCLESIIECNLYQYTGNNPVNIIGLDGLDLNSIFENAVNDVIYHPVDLEVSLNDPYLSVTLKAERATAPLPGSLEGLPAGGKIAGGGQIKFNSQGISIKPILEVSAESTIEIFKTELKMVSKTTIDLAGGGSVTKNYAELAQGVGFDSLGVTGTAGATTDGQVFAKGTANIGPGKLVVEGGATPSTNLGDVINSMENYVNGVFDAIDGAIIQAYEAE